jgi:hypothetical protein
LGAPPPLSAIAMYVATAIPAKASSAAAIRNLRSEGTRQC